MCVYVLCLCVCVCVWGGGGGVQDKGNSKSVTGKPGLYTEISPRGGGANLGYKQKRGGAVGGNSVVSCEVLHSRGGGGGGARMTQGGANAPPPHPPLNTAL